LEEILNQNNQFKVLTSINPNKLYFILKYGLLFNSLETDKEITNNKLYKKAGIIFNLPEDSISILDDENVLIPNNDSIFYSKN